MKVILASSSTRRKNILKLSGLPFDVVSPEVEEIIDGSLSYEDIVINLSSKKVSAVAKNYRDDVIIGCDTIITLGDAILGKPRDESHAFSMLKMLSGKTNTAYTGVTVLYKNKIKRFYESTQVTMCELTDEMINKYIATKEPFGKAGSYAIQGHAAAFVEKIDGNYLNVMGFPLPQVVRAIREVCPEMTGLLF